MIATIRVAVVLLCVVDVAWPAGLTLPRRLDAYITKYVKLTAAEQTRLAAGQPVTNYSTRTCRRKSPYSARCG